MTTPFADNENETVKKTAESGCHCKLSDDLKTVTLTFTFPGKDPAFLQLDAKGVDGLLQNLGLYRHTMKPEVPDTMSPGVAARTVPDPKWFVEPERLNGGSILHIRDTRFGWLHYTLSLAMAKKLGGFLQNQAVAQPLEAKKGDLH